MKPKLLVIDGDEIVYKVGFSCQKTLPSFAGNLFEDVTDLEFFGCCNDIDVSQYTRFVKVEEAFIAHNRAKTFIESLLHVTESADFQILLSGQGNFREALATMLPYKGNRDSDKNPSARPSYYSMLRLYMKERYGDRCIFVDGIESDDQMSIMSWQSKLGGVYHDYDVIIATQDKDLDMVPGWRINTKRMDLNYIEPHIARNTFYRQVLTGDATDNIPGVYRIGPKKAAEIIPDSVNLDISDAELYTKVLIAYKNALKNPSIASHMPGSLTVEERVLEVARLVWMLRDRNEMWEPNMAYYHQV